MGYTVYITANRYYEVHIKDAKDTDDAMQQALAKYDNGSSKAMKMSLNRRSQNRRMIDWQVSGKPVGYQKLRIAG